MAARCAAEGVDHPQYLLRLAELELIDRHQRMVQRRIRAARFPAVKSLDTFDFTAIPSVNKQLVMELARCEYIQRRENVIAVGNSGTGKTHVALGLGLAACQRGMSVGFTTAAALVHEMMEARDEKRLLNLQRQLSRLSLLIIDEQGFVPLSPTGAELLFEVFSQRYERGSVMVTTNLPFDEWTEVFGSERLTGALLDRLTHHVHILEMNGDSYRLNALDNRVDGSAGSIPGLLNDPAILFASGALRELRVESGCRRPRFRRSGLRGPVHCAPRAIRTGNGLGGCGAPHSGRGSRRARRTLSLSRSASSAEPSIRAGSGPHELGLVPGNPWLPARGLWFARELGPAGVRTRGLPQSPVRVTAGPVAGAAGSAGPMTPFGVRSRRHNAAWACRASPPLDRGPLVWV